MNCFRFLVLIGFLNSFLIDFKHDSLQHPIVVDYVLKTCKHPTTTLFCFVHELNIRAYLALVVALIHFIKHCLDVQTWWSVEEPGLSIQCPYKENSSLIL